MWHDGYFKLKGTEKQIAQEWTAPAPGYETFIWEAENLSTKKRNTIILEDSDPEDLNELTIMANLIVKLTQARIIQEEYQF